MRGLLMPALAIALAVLGFAPAAAVATPQNAAFELHVDVPNVARASNGDTLAITGGGVFATHPKTVTVTGSFTHTVAGGSPITGTWTATNLISFQFYGCGSVPAIGLTLPPNFCGGVLKMRVRLTPAGTTVTLPGIITVFCVIGSKAPPPHDNPTQVGEEGITAVVPGVANFNKIVAGMNRYVRTS
jgi:hypothetical protein